MCGFANPINRSRAVLYCVAKSYSAPGGFYRYTVRVGPRQYLVDDIRRLAIGEPIGIALPAAALHLYPTMPATKLP
jgi:hypothetical protein